MRIHAAALALTAALVPFPAYAQDPPTAPPDAQAQDAGGGRGGRAPEPQMRPYDRVITKEAKSDQGIFTVHRIKDRLFYEIPKDKLGKEFLWVSQIAKTTLGAGYGGQAAGNRVVKWERRGDRILLRSVSYEVVADATTPISKAVQAANYDSDPHGFQHRGHGKRRRAGDRGDAPLHDRRAGVQRTDPCARTDLRHDTIVRRARRLVPGEHRSRGHAHL